jgi:bacterioferritin-associated ferredoxin
MYVCICSGVSDRQVRAALAAGARTLDDLSMALGVGVGCGCCRDAAREYIDAAGRCAGDCAACARVATAAA